MGRLSTKHLIERRHHRLLGPMAHRMLRYLSGVEFPSEVTIGPDLVIHHHGFGLVIHPHTTIGARVHLFHGVTIGRAHVWEAQSASLFEGIVIEDDVWLCAGAKVLGTTNLRVGRGTVVGANAVLTCSTGEWEIWAGAPARCVGTRPPSLWHNVNSVEQIPATNER